MSSKKQPDFYPELAPQLWAAVEAEDYAEMDRLFRADPDLSPDLERREGCGAMLHYAIVHKNSLRLAQYMISKGATVDMVCNYGIRPTTPLMLAAAHSDQDGVPFIDLLVGNGADVNFTPGFEGGGALHSAAKQGGTLCVQRLLDAKADIEVTNKNSHTPLHIASLGRRLDIALVLLKNGADETKLSGAERLRIQDALHIFTREKELKKIHAAAVAGTAKIVRPCARIVLPEIKPGPRKF